MPRCLWYKVWVGLIPAATLDSRGRLWLCCSSSTALQRGRYGVTSKALLMSFCLQISDDGRPWQLSSEERGTAQVLRFLILTSPYPAFPELQMSSKRPQISQLLSALNNSKQILVLQYACGLPQHDEWQYRRVLDRSLLGTWHSHAKQSNSSLELCTNTFGNFRIGEV